MPAVGDTSMNIILATRNESKMEQIRASFAGSSVQILSMKDAGIEGEAKEDGDTLRENSYKKAKYVFDKLQGAQWVMADDTGLFIRALGGVPGVHAAYWGGSDLKTEERTAHALKEMEGKTDRHAEFRVTVCVLGPGGEEAYFNGQVEGQLLPAPRCQPQPKMPYSGLFKPEISSKVWAEMSVEEENEISHRGKAFAKVREYLESQPDS